MSTIISVDTGGTFTDLVAYDTVGGQTIYTKSLTTYGDLVQGVLAAIDKAGVDLSDAALIKFGTTLVINTFVQRNGARTALVTTDGFRDVLELRRGNRPFPFDLHYYPDPPLVERELRLEVGGRIAADGSELIPLDLDGLRAAAATLARLDIEALAVSFINAYANPAHEIAAVDLLSRHLPGVYVTRATELSREWHEYERTSTAVANAYVGPRLQDYVSRLSTRLGAGGLSKPFFMMASNGGVFSTGLAERQPVMLLESGPVGGCIGACAYANALGATKLIAFDMGGTTAKCAVVEDGNFETRSPYYVGGYEYGFPIHGAVVDIVEVGAGGGSIARMDAHGRLLVGPQSAGSEPGPAAYGRGGTEPTITDANLVLGRISASSFLGGELVLDAAAARTAIRDKVAMPLCLQGEAGIDEAAGGILALGVATMASAIRQVTIERGLDPREFSLFAYGGGGPLHAIDLARELSIPEVIIPLEPGNFSAIGMLVSDARVDETSTFLRLLAPEAIPEMTVLYGSMEATVAGKLAGEVAISDLRLQRLAELRYRGQKQGIRIDTAGCPSAADIRRTFEAVYLKRYGHVDTQSPLEFVSLSLVAHAGMQRPALDSMRIGKQRGRAAETEKTRCVFFNEVGGRRQTAVYQRAELMPGFTHTGPAVIEEYGSTTVVGPSDRLTIGKLSEIRIHIGQA